MGLALFGAGARAGLAADAVSGVGHGHDLVAHVIAELVFSLKRLFDEFKHIPAANLVASAAADTFIDIDGFNESRRPCLSAARISRVRMLQEGAAPRRLVRRSPDKR